MIGCYNTPDFALFAGTMPRKSFFFHVIQPGVEILSSGCPLYLFTECLLYMFQRPFLVVEFAK